MLHDPWHGIKEYFRLCASGPRAALGQESRHPPPAGRQCRCLVLRLAQGGGTPAGPQTNPGHWGANISVARHPALHSASGLHWLIPTTQHWQPLALALPVSWGWARKPEPYLHSYILKHRSARWSALPQQRHSLGQGQYPHITSPRCSRTRLSQSLSYPDG